MSKVQDQMNEFLKSKGFFHKEKVSQTYKCKPYNKETVRYNRPKPDPEGTAEYTYVSDVDIIDELSVEERADLLSLEQQKALDSVLLELKEVRKENTQLLRDINYSVDMIQKIAIGYAILTVISIALSLMAALA